MKRIFTALGAFSLAWALTLALGLGPVCAAAEPQEEAVSSSGYLVILSQEAPELPVAADPMAAATLSAAQDEREELLPLAERIGIYKASDLSDIQNLVYSGQVALVEPDYQAELFDADRVVAVTPNDQYFKSTYQYNLTGSHSIRAQAAWDAGLTGQGVTVAVIDSGLNVSHRDAPVKIARGRYFYYKEDPNGRYELRDSSGTLRKYTYMSSSNYVDDIGHGSMVSGIIAANTDNSLGVAGIAPNVTILPIKCFTKEEHVTSQGVEERHLGGYTSNLISGLNYARENGADIISMSWGVKAKSTSLEAAITDAANAGCILIAAAGNDGASTLQYPAAYSNVIGVGSTDRDGALSSFSQRNSSADVCAPGSDIYSLGYSSASSIAHGNGTSFAAPAVAAAAALLKEADSAMTQGDFLALLSGHCDGVGGYVADNATEKKPYVGYGLLNLQKLLDAQGHTGAVLDYGSGVLRVQGSHHPVQTARPTGQALVLIAAYNAQNHLLDSQLQAVSASDYGGFSFTAQFGADPSIAAVRVFFLDPQNALAALDFPVEQAVAW